jgi:beta-lactamase class A
MKSAARRLRHIDVAIWVRKHKRQLLIGFGVFIGTIILVQLLYPGDRLLPFSKIDERSVSMWHKSDAVKQLDAAYKNYSTELYFGTNKSASHHPKPSEFGLVVRNDERVRNMDYPWYIRLVPTSLLWYGKARKPEPPRYERNQAVLSRYVKEKLGDNCKVDPVNATLRAKDVSLEIVPSSKGGTCELPAVEKVLLKVSPQLTAENKAIVPMKEIPPVVSDKDAEALRATIISHLKQEVSVQAGQERVVVPAKTIVSWLDFSVVENKLTVAVSADRSKDFMTKEIAPKVVVPAGVTKVATVDFAEVSRVNGQTGQTLDVGATGGDIAAFLRGEVETATTRTQPVAPRIEYTRSYSPTDTGLSALMANYAKDHPGTYGVQMIELSGKRRRAAYNESTQFTTASTYKLFVAYGTLKKVEAGEWHWTDATAGGRDMAACFDDMIVKSDNACAEALLKRYGYSELTRDIRALGLSGASGFTSAGPRSTAADLGLFMAMLESGQLPIQPGSRDRFIGALKRNIYRQGIPAGASGAVANKVGFLEGLLHDAAIVYSPSGTYVLVVMTDGAKWSNIAELTKQIEQLRVR